MKRVRKKLLWSTIVPIIAYRLEPGYDDSVDVLLADAVDNIIPKQMKRDDVTCDGVTIVFTPKFPINKTSNVPSDVVTGTTLDVKFMLFEDKWALCEIEIPTAEAHEIIAIKNRIFKLLKLEEE